VAHKNVGESFDSFLEEEGILEQTEESAIKKADTIMANNYEYTRIDDNLYQCNDCGAYSEDPREVKHFATCKPGESKYWEKFYEENPDK
jgi:hypothetical protein